MRPIEQWDWPGRVVHAFHASTWEGETAWSTEHVQGQPGLWGETPSQKTKQIKTTTTPLKRKEAICCASILMSPESSVLLSQSQEAENGNEALCLNSLFTQTLWHTQGDTRWLTVHLPTQAPWHADFSWETHVFYTTFWRLNRGSTKIALVAPPRLEYT